MRRHSVFALAGVSSVLVAAVACSDDEPRSCSVRACPDSYFNLIQSDWEEGEYELEISYSELEEDVTYLCEFRIEGELSDAAEEDAGASRRYGDCMRTTGIHHFGANVEVTRNVRLGLRSSPSTLRLTLRRAGQTLFEDTITPDYTVVYPNGRHCNVCDTTDTDIEL